MHPSQAAGRHVPPRVVRITARGGLANDRKLPAGHRELPVRVRAPAEHCVALVDRARVELAARKLRTKAAVQPAGRPPRPSCSRAGRGAGAVRHRGGRTPAPSRASSSPSSAHSQCSLPRCRTPRRAPPRRRTPRACAGRCPARRRWSPSIRSRGLSGPRMCATSRRTRAATSLGTAARPGPRGSAPSSASAAPRRSRRCARHPRQLGATSWSLGSGSPTAQCCCSPSSAQYRCPSRRTRGASPSRLRATAGAPARSAGRIRCLPSTRQSGFSAPCTTPGPRTRDGTGAAPAIGYPSRSRCDILRAAPQRRQRGGSEAWSRRGTRTPPPSY